MATLARKRRDKTRLSTAAIRRGLELRTWQQREGCTRSHTGASCLRSSGAPCPTGSRTQTRVHMHDGVPKNELYVSGAPEKEPSPWTTFLLIVWRCQRVCCVFVSFNTWFGVCSICSLEKVSPYFVNRAKKAFKTIHGRLIYSFECVRVSDRWLNSRTRVETEASWNTDNTVTTMIILWISREMNSFDINRKPFVVCAVPNRH